jgi:hypothetical protein
MLLTTWRSRYQTSMLGSGAAGTEGFTVSRNVFRKVPR